jgi:hypothetical protein
VTKGLQIVPEEIQESESSTEEESGQETQETQGQETEAPDPVKTISKALQNEQYKRSNLEKQVGSIRESLGALSESIESLRSSGGKEEEKADPTDYVTLGALDKAIERIGGQIEKSITPIREKQIESEVKAREKAWLGNFDSDFPEHKGSGPAVLKEYQRLTKHFGQNATEDAMEDALDAAIELVSSRSKGTKKKPAKSPSGTTKIVQEGASATQSSDTSKDRKRTDAMGNPDWSGVSAEE